MFMPVQVSVLLSLGPFKVAVKFSSCNMMLIGLYQHRRVEAFLRLLLSQVFLMEGACEV